MHHFVAAEAKAEAERAAAKDRLAQAKRAENKKAQQTQGSK